MAKRYPLDFPASWKIFRLWLKMPGGRKRLFFAVLKVFGVCLLVPLAVWFWPQTLEILKRQRQRKIYDRLYGRKPSRRFQPPYDKEKVRMRKAWNEWFDLQKELSWVRLEQIRKEWDEAIAKQQKTKTK
jgi:hypothetical protein